MQSLQIVRNYHRNGASKLPCWLWRAASFAPTCSRWSSCKFRCQNQRIAFGLLSAPKERLRWAFYLYLFGDVAGDESLSVMTCMSAPAQIVRGTVVCLWLKICKASWRKAQPCAGFLPRRFDYTNFRWQQENETGVQVSAREVNRAAWGRSLPPTWSKKTKFWANWGYKIDIKISQSLRKSPGRKTSLLFGMTGVNFRTGNQSRLWLAWWGRLWKSLCTDLSGAPPAELRHFLLKPILSRQKILWNLIIAVENV
jgi:hypothetical protein